MLSRNITRSTLKRIARLSASQQKQAARSMSATCSRQVWARAPAAAVAAPLRQHQVRARSVQFQWQSSRGNATVVKVPDMAESITEGTLASFSKQVGEYVELDETIATIETDKIDVEVNAPVAGTITELLVSPEDTVEVGQEIVKIEAGAKPEGDAAAAPEPKSEPAAAPEASKDGAAAAAPAEAPAAAPAAEKKAAPATPATKKEAAPATKKATPAAAPAEAKAPKAAFSRSEERVKMNRMRLRIAERLKESQNTAASLTTFNEVDMTSLMEMRKLYKDEFLANTGIKFGFMGAFTKAATLAMKDIPSANAAIEGSEMVFRDYTDVSIAVATPKGLVTPVVRNAESLSVLEVEQEIANLGKKARDGKLTLEDMAGGTFTISNGGVFGSLYGTPIINLPQTAVLGLHGVKQRPVVVNGKIEARPMMYLALTYDHRLLDGREAVTFLKTIKELIEDPRKMLLF